MARKTILPDAIAASKPGGQLINHFRDRLNENLNDGRENHSPPVYRAGFGGRLMVSGQRGWMWTTRVHPDGGGIPFKVAVPTDADNNPIPPINVGNAVSVTRTVGTSPTQWEFGGIGSQDDNVDFHVWVGSCATIPDGYVCPPGTYLGYPNNWHDASGGNAGKRCVGPDGGIVDAIPVTDLTNYLKAQELKNATKTTTATGVKIVDGFPSTPVSGDTISLRGENATYIYIGAYGIGGWQVQSGPTSGVFTLSYTASALTAGQLVCFPPGINEVIPVDNRDASILGWMVGMVVYNRAAATYALIQTEGDFPVAQSFTQNTPLYMGLGGWVTTTPPASGSGQICQRVGYGRNKSSGSNSYITIDPDIGVLRSGTVTITQGDPDEMKIDNVPNNTISTIAAFKFVGMDNTGMWLANVASGANKPGYGFTIASVASSANGSIFEFGNLSGFVGLTPGATYYADPTSPGSITNVVPSTAGQLVQRVGTANYDGTSLLVDVDREPYQI